MRLSFRQLEVPADLLGKSERHAAVQALAPSGTLTGGGKRGFEPLLEPSALVDALLDPLKFSREGRERLGRQRLLCERC